MFVVYFDQRLGAAHSKRAYLKCTTIVIKLNIAFIRMGGVGIVTVYTILIFSNRKTYFRFNGYNLIDH